MTSTAADSTGDGSSSLDCILKNTEFENTQQEKAIETERERIRAYEKQLEEKLRQRRELEESTVSLQEQVERLNKQLELNRENSGSLKRTTVVLDEHKEALQRKLKATLLEYEQQRSHHEQALSKYEDIWASYHAKYESFAKAQELQKRFEELQLVDEQHATLEKQIQELNVSLTSLQLECDDQGITRVLQIASWGVDTEDNTKTAAANEEKAELLLKQVVELEEGVARAEAVQWVQEANKLQDDHDVAMMEEPSNHLITDKMPPGLLPDATPSAVQQYAPSHQLTTSTPPAHGPATQSLMYSKPTTKSSARDMFTFPQIPARPTSNSIVSEKTDAKLIKPPPISLPASKHSAANTGTIPGNQSLGTSRYLLEIPLSMRSSTAAQNKKVSLQSSSRDRDFQRQKASSAPTPSISLPARSHLQIPSLKTPSRPQPSTAPLSMTQEKATQQPKASHQRIPGFQLTVPVTQVPNMHSENAREVTPTQEGTTSRASKVVGSESIAKVNKSNSENDVHSLERMSSKIQTSLPVLDVQDKNGSTQNWEGGSDEQPDQLCDMEANQNTEVDASAYEGYYPSDMQGYMQQQYAMYGGQILEYDDSGVAMQIPQGEEADGLGTEPLEEANEFFPSANESAPGGFLFGGFGLSGAADGFSGGFSFLPESSSQSEGVSGSKANQPGMSFSLFEGGSPGASTQTQGGSDNGRHHMMRSFRPSLSMDVRKSVRGEHGYETI